jgi:hypothetical protein
MAEWTSNNLACLHLWTSLYIMKQLRKTFKDSGVLKMKELLFYNPLLTQNELEFEARGIADHLDIVFRKTWGAKYETGVDRNKAVNDMTGILITANKTVADLAENIHNNYEFPKFSK